MPRESRVLSALKACLPAMVLALGTSGCVSLQVQGTQAGQRSYFGWVRIRFEPGPDFAVLRSLDAEVAGLRVDRGFALGYVRDRSIEIPADCRLVLIVRDVEEFKAALQLLDHHAEESQRCVIQNWR